MLVLIVYWTILTKQVAVLTQLCYNIVIRTRKKLIRLRNRPRGGEWAVERLKYWTIGCRNQGLQNLYSPVQIWVPPPKKKPAV